MSTVDIPAQFNPLAPEFLTNPYPIYSTLRHTSPVHFMSSLQTWWITSYELVAEGFKNPYLSSRTGIVDPALAPEPLRDMMRYMSNTFLRMDAPDHTRLRNLVHKAFTPRIIEQLRTRIQAIADDLLDAVEAKGRMDVIADFAFPLPIIVIGDLLGVPAKDHKNFRAWATDQMAATDMNASLDAMKRGSQSFAEFNTYLKTLIEIRRKAPQEDLLSALIAAESEGHKLTEEEMVSATNIILLAGHETSASLIGSGLAALLKNQHQFDLLKAHESLLPSAVEEMLRYNSPAQFMARITTKEVEIGGQVIPSGQKVALMIASANHDETVFEQADVFDIERTPNPHIAFGLGAHFCLGAPLARLEAQIAFATLLRRLPNLRLDTDTLTYRPMFRVRGLDRLSVTFDAR